ncbi:hypothetical protein V6N13_108321 [Hibiscus sabdariffa]
MSEKQALPKLVAPTVDNNGVLLELKSAGMVGGSRFATLQDLRENNEYVYGHWENTMSPNHVGSAHTEKKVMNRDKNNEQAKEVISLDDEDGVENAVQRLVKQKGEH